jgi:peptidoglycan/xylan/chitin deacetylase (PgdA/CDA1 family)
VLGAAKEAVALAVRWSPTSTLVRNAYARSRASILFYHDPAPEVFARHVEYMAKRYRFVPLASVVEAIRTRDWSGVPPKSMVITFDDGHRGTFRLLDLFKRYGVHPTIYLCSQVVGTNRHYWFSEARQDTDSATEALKRLPEAERRHELRRRYGFDREREYPTATRQALSREEIGAMREHVDFQAHTRFHPILTTCSDSECREEIAAARGEVERLLGRECRHFSYPNGDYGARERAVAETSGYLSARSIDIGWNGPRTDPYVLKVLGTPDDASVARLAADLTGFGRLWRLRDGSLTGRHRSIPPPRPRG